ncbi:thiamine pyrophosphate-binding protein [Burkholderia cepacia]|uniref:thiamine pyrophosphate-binding protein n=1 Tax=Burkholderia cepacia TaxID=292 RepID=UPI00158A0654|nr:thiamine pyrophosphate-binding protein [Burkholderia cepacia]
MDVNQRRSSVANVRAGIDTSFVALIDVEHRGGAAILVDVLRGEGARNVFGNSGTMQLLFIDALTDAPDPSFTFGRPNISIDAIADGYVHASGRSDFTSSHTVNDLSHAMGPPLNSKAARTPLIVNADPHDSRHAFAEPLLHGNLLGVTRPAVRWAPNVSQALLPAPGDEWRDTRVELALCGRAAQRVRIRTHRTRGADRAKPGHRDKKRLS